MSAQFAAHLKHLSDQVSALKTALDGLSDRVLALEAEELSETSRDVDIDTLQVVPKRRGRPPKVKHEASSGH